MKTRAELLEALGYCRDGMEHPWYGCQFFGQTMCAGTACMVPAFLEWVLGMRAGPFAVNCPDSLEQDLRRVQLEETLAELAKASGGPHTEKLR